jgi:hypothetical protein
MRAARGNLKGLALDATGVALLILGTFVLFGSIGARSTVTEVGIVVWIAGFGLLFGGSFLEYLRM